MHIPLPRPAVLASVGVLTLTGALAACSAATPANSTDAVRVVASTTQVCDFVTQIASHARDEEGRQQVRLHRTNPDGSVDEIGSEAQAGPRIDLNCLLAPNASAHDHEMTPQQMSALAAADLLVVNGLDLERFLDSAIESSGFHGTLHVSSGILSSSTQVETSAQAAPYVTSQGPEQVFKAPWPFAPEPGEDAEFTFDPHVWTSPFQALVQITNIGSALADATADNEAVRQGAATYKALVEDLDSWTRASVESVPTEERTLFTSHDAFGYFARDYDVDFIGSALSDFNNQQDATSGHIDQVVHQVKASGATVLFAENSNNSKSIEAVARAAGVRAVIGDDALYGDSLGPAGSAGASYIGSIVHNVSTLVQEWGGTLAPLPDALANA